MIYDRECIVCHTKFTTRDSRIVTDTLECRMRSRRVKSKMRYKTALENGDLLHWNKSKTPGVKLVCRFLLKHLPARRTDLEAALQVHLQAVGSPILVTDATVQNCLTRLRLAKDAYYDADDMIWRKGLGPDKK